METNVEIEYKLLALDLDGTLTKSNKEISQRNLTTLIQLQQRGVRLILASGRPPYGIIPLAEKLQMRKFGGFILAYNGGEVIDYSTGELLYKHLLPTKVLPALYDVAIRSNHTILTYHYEHIITENPDNQYVQKVASLNKMRLLHASNFLEKVTFPVPKCLLVGDPEQLVQTEAELALRLQGEVNVFRSEPYFLEIVPSGIDKALSLEKLLTHLNLKREQLMAMGDGYNDISMIKFAGCGVAMANAQEVVKQVADAVTLSNDEDGVAVYIERFFNSKND